MFKNLIPMALKAGIIKKVNKKKNKKKTNKIKKTVNAKYSMFKQKSIINRQISNSRNFFKKEDK